jgi:curved DNA-binding protein CbpA
VENYYSLLGISQTAAPEEIKKAFREKAKRLHPDIAGEKAAGGMRNLLTAYEVLSDPDRRFKYDRAYTRFTQKYHFDYRTFLREQEDDLESQAKLIFFELLHLEEDAALAIWQKRGGLDFPMEKYLDREDWMDCTYILAEELAGRDRYYEAFFLLLRVVREERRRPYFKHFIQEVEGFLKEIVRLKLRSAVDPETYVECIEALLELGFHPRDEARWMRSMAESLVRVGETGAASRVFKEALRRDPSLSSTLKLRQKLNV